MKAPVFFLVLSLFCFFSSVHAQDQHITIGNGGGMSGNTTVFKITPSGKVYKGSGLGEIKYAECAKIRKARAKKFITAVAAQTKAAGEFNHPGNMYYFLSSTDGSKITWGDANHPVGEDVKKLYTEIQNVVSSLKYKPVKS